MNNPYEQTGQPMMPPMGNQSAGTPDILNAWWASLDEATKMGIAQSVQQQMQPPAMQQGGMPPGMGAMPDSQQQMMQQKPAPMRGLLD